MKSLTIRNIPDHLMNKIKILSDIEKRSMNNEILLILERGLLMESNTSKNQIISKETQINIWNKLSGEWKDKRKTSEIIDDIYSNRSNGREFSL